MTWEDQVARFKVLEEFRNGVWDHYIESGNFRDYNLERARMMIAREELILAVRYLAVSIVDKYRKHSNRRDEYVSEGFHAIVDGVDLFRLDKGVRWTTYSAKCVYYRMLKIDKNSTLISIPTYIHEGREHRPPDLEGVSLEDLRKRCTPGSISRESRSAGSTKSPETPITYNNDVDEIDRRDNLEAVKKAMKCLTDRERFVIENRMGGKTLDEVGQLLGVTRERIRQIETVAHNRLRQKLLRLGYVHEC